MRSLSLLLVLCCAAAAQQIKLPDRVTFLGSVAPVSVTAGASKSVTLDFRVASGFHINSHKPNSELLVPTNLSLEPPTDVVIGKVVYPAGVDANFAFAPAEMLNVYTGKFAVTALVAAAKAATPGKYRVHASLRYQACDDRACYPPKSVPADFDVTVLRSKASGPARTGQSPHIHN